MCQPSTKIKLQLTSWIINYSISEGAEFTNGPFNDIFSLIGLQVVTKSSNIHSWKLASGLEFFYNQSSEL